MTRGKEGMDMKGKGGKESWKRIELLLNYSANKSIANYATNSENLQAALFLSTTGSRTFEKGHWQGLGKCSHGYESKRW